MTQRLQSIVYTRRNENTSAQKLYRALHRGIVPNSCKEGKPQCPSAEEQINKMWYVQK